MRIGILLFTLGLVLPVAISLAADDDSDALFAKASRHLNDEEFEEAVAALNRVIAADGDRAAAYYHRGRALFRLNEVAKSVKDFDHYVKLRPQIESRQWERGIAMYYAKLYKRGAAQFALYQTYHDNDVENSVWRFLCMTPTDGFAKARQAMLPIKNDRRVPMMQIYEMFRGELTPDEVLAECRKDKPSAEVLDGRLFYARLYLGLYYEAAGKKELAKKYIYLAADEHKDSKRINNYMWAVADVHAKRLRAAAKSAPREKPQKR
jgi:lipoprotein NlpI